MSKTDLLVKILQLIFFSTNIFLIVILLLLLFFQLIKANQFLVVLNKISDHDQVSKVLR